MAKSIQVQQTIKKYFDKNKYSYNVEEKEAFILYSGFRTFDGNSVIGLTFVVYDSNVDLTATYSEEQKADNYVTIAEFLLRVNRFLKRGHFFLDYETGSINFKVWSGIKGKFAGEDVEDMISLAVGSIESCIPGITDIVNGKVTAETAAWGYLKKGENNEE